jgi:hypothetical protein
MDSHEREEKTEEIRALFVKTGHGRFRLLREIFTPEELLTKNPLVLIKLTYSRLSLEKNAFNEDSFRRWLKRNRNKKGRSQADANIPSATTKPPGSFQFTDPATIKKSNDSIIKFA